MRPWRKSSRSAGEETGDTASGRQRVRRWHRWAVCLAAGVAVTACDQPAGIVSAPPTLAMASLDSFDDCGDALGHLRTLGASRVTAWGLDGLSGHGGPSFFEDGISLPGDIERQVGGAPTTTTPTSAEARTTEEFSQTNVQVLGVDEPDVVKTDGSTLYWARGQVIDIIDVSGSTPRQISRHRLGAAGARLLVDDGVLVALQSDHQQLPSRAGAPIRPGTPRTIITEIDVSDPAQTLVRRTTAIEGNLVGARLVDGELRVVVDFDPYGFPFVYPSGSDTSVALATNRRVIADSSIDDWLPTATVTVGRRTVTRRALACSSLHRPPSFSGFGQASVYRLDIQDTSSRLQGASVLGDAAMVYATADRVYLGTNEWADFSATPQLTRMAEENYSTAIHAFGTPPTGSVHYLGSGRVPGHALNQFSLDEHRGDLRVVTTEGAPWSGGTESFVTVLRLEGDELRPIGRVGGLGKGERVQSVRFVGDRGYVVTFRQIDPLYTLDLSDPVDPRVLGELKIPGFSSYLHPIDGDRLIGVGSDADPETGRVTGLLVSLFDVSNPARPQQVSSLTVGAASSLAAVDHHAFLYWPATGLLVVPVVSYEDNFTGAMGLRVDGSSLSEVGLVRHLDPANPFAWPELIDRSLVLRDVLLTTSRLGLKTSDLADLSDRSWLALPVEGINPVDRPIVEPRPIVVAGPQRPTIDVEAVSPPTIPPPTIPTIEVLDQTNPAAFALGRSR